MGVFNVECLNEVKKKKKKAVSAQDQVGGKVNSGIMFNMMCGGGMMEGAEPESDEYMIGSESDGEYKHVCESKHDDNNKLKDYMLDIARFMKREGLNVSPFPKLELDRSKQDGLFIKTGYYLPSQKKVVVFCSDRNDKDILRSFAHEMIHHMQNLNGVDLSFGSNDNVKDSSKLEKIEAEAYLKGNILFRKWTEYKQQNDSENLNETKRKSKTKPRLNDEGDVVPQSCEKCGGKVGVYIQGEPIFKCSKCGKYYGVLPCNINENTITELDADDVDLSSFNLKNRLNPKFWKNGKLDSRIRMKLLDIADDFIEFLGIEWVKPKDIIMTGSLANYNWNSDYSDIDLHILLDYNDVDERKDFVEKYFKSQKDIWNKEHNRIEIFGFPVELYVQDVNEPHTSTGVYSLESDEWIDEPNLKKLETSKINKNEIKKKVAYYATQTDNLMDEYESSEGDKHKIEIIRKKSEKLFDKIKQERKKGLNNSSTEITTGNIIFKCLRRLNCLDKLSYLKRVTYDEVSSLNENNENEFKVYMMFGCPGSGKSTWLKNNLPEIPIVSRDVIRSSKELGYCKDGEKFLGTKEQENKVSEIEDRLIDYYCDNKVDFAIDDTNLNPKYRKPLIEKLRKKGAKIILVVVNASLEDCKTARNGQIDPNVIEKIHKKIQIPNKDEYDKIIFFNR